MATGRTISASFLTSFDKKVIELCEEISNTISASIYDKDLKKKFLFEYGKISFTRDGGMGLGAGKIQRDALCTRGRQGKAPYSNRNLRFHPLIVADEKPNYAKKIERIEICGEDKEQILIFVIKNKNKEVKYPSDKVHELPERYVVLPKHWINHIDTLKSWDDVQWTQNSCVIPAYEASEWYDCVETYAILALSIASGLFKLNINNLYKDICNILKNQDIDKNKKLPTNNFPKNNELIINCPVCLLPISNQLESFRKENRGNTWQPAWRGSKKSEGNDGSIQLLHVSPLIESEIRHKSDLVRYGHRWCNVAMTDHSLDETLNFMEHIVKEHNKCIK